jgi:hypothetical protein
MAGLRKVNPMNRSIDVRTEVRKLASSKPVYAAAGAGLLASQALREMLASPALRELPARLAKWRSENNVGTLPTRATEYMQTARTKAAESYEHLADRGMKALASQGTTPGKTALNGKGK